MTTISNTPTVSSIKRHAAAVPAPGAATQARAGGPQVVARAQGGDPLPGFPDARAYQNYVINLVAQTRQLEREIETAGKIAGANKPNDVTVMALRERLDATKLQLKILRDDMPIPAAWTRWRVAGGEGFDKDKFWREQVEAIPGKPVVVTPAPAPAPAQPPAPRPRPAAPVPAQAPAVHLPAQPADPRVAQLLQLALAAHQGGLSSAAVNGFTKATAASPTAGDAMAVFLAAHQNGYSTAAGNASYRARELSPDTATSLAIAVASHEKGYSTAASNAFGHATRQAPNQAQALQVALTAHQKGYSTAASNAFARATELSTTSAEALQVGENAYRKGYSTAQSNAMRRAMELP